MSLDWKKKKTILEQSNNDRITLHNAKWMCTIVLSAKCTIKSIPPLIKKGQLQSPSMEYCYLSLSLSNRLAYCWIHPSIPLFLQFRLPNNLLVIIFPPMWWQAFESQVSHLTMQCQDPWTGFKFGPIDHVLITCRVYDINHWAMLFLTISTSEESENYILYRHHTWRCIHNQVIQVTPRHIG